jgi:hypothetical protein
MGLRIGAAVGSLDGLDVGSGWTAVRATDSDVVELK